MKITEISLDVNDLENKQITFRFRCRRCSTDYQSDIRDLLVEHPVCWRCPTNLGLIDLISLDIKQF